MSDLDSGDDWEEVEVPVPSGNIEITLEADEAPVEKKRQGISHAERLLRIDCHKIHTVCLLISGRIRNNWLNDRLLHARLLSLTPITLQNSFTKIRKADVPDQVMRGHLFENAVRALAEWWSHTYFHIDYEGHLRNITFDEVQAQIAGLSLDEVIEFTEGADNCEVVRSSKSLMKHALNRTGTRDVSAQLFTALCRGLGIPARLVFSLQSMPWQASVGKPKTTVPRKLKPTETAEAPSSSSSQVDLKGKGKRKEDAFVGEGSRMDGRAILPPPSVPKAKPVINLRKTKSKGNKLGSSATGKQRPLVPPDPLKAPPVYWTEVFSRADAQWLPVDPIRGVVNKRKIFDPVAAPVLGGEVTTIRKTRTENRMLYVVAYEEDGFGRDVTPRYAHDYSARIAKVQCAGARATGKSRTEWWESVVGMIRRPYQLHRDDLEEEELRKVQYAEGMPTTMTGFKDHPVYVLARHLTRDQVIYPLTELGKFRGEPVYGRSCVRSLKTADNWMRSGRRVKSGVQPMKWVKQRAATVQKQREIVAALEERERIREMQKRMGIDAIPDEGGEEQGILQGMYARDQTELYVPPPIVDGKVPKNDFGNIDLYVPSMLPQGAVHVPHKGIAKIARKLGISHAEAVTGFEFKRRAATPILQGVVVAIDKEAILLEAYWESEKEAGERARVKQEERVMKRWIRLVQGLRIRKRLQEQYADRGDVNPASGNGEIVVAVPVEVPQEGGFMAADNVVGKYSLPKFQHVPLEMDNAHFSGPAAVASGSRGVEEEEIRPTITYDLELLDDDQEEEEVEEVVPRATKAPLRMSDLAETHVPLPPKPTRASPSKIKILPPRRPERKAAAPKPKARTARKRAREDSDVSQSESEGSAASSVKRARPTAATATRVLRPRATKSTAQIEDDKELERKFRAATAG